MKTLRHYLLEIYQLFEDKVSDLAKLHPNVPVTDYGNKDNTTNKKFLPWLISQHKKGNVTPDHPDLESTLHNYDKYKTKHGITDHSKLNFAEVAEKVKPHIGSSATNKEQKKQEIDTGVEHIHSEPNGITAQHIKTKEASQNLYGGGTERGGEPGGARGTSWCVSARSDECLFGKHYGSMYTIHAPNDPDAPYAFHPEKGLITNRHNDNDKDVDNVLKLKPHLKKAVAKIKEHHVSTLPEDKQLEYLVDNTPHKLQPHHIDKIFSGDDSSLKETVLRNHKIKSIGEKHLDTALDDPDVNVRHAAIGHPRLTKNHLDKAITDSSPSIRRYVLRNPNSTPEHLDKIVNDTDPNNRFFVVDHPNITREHLDKLSTDSNDRVKRAANRRLQGYDYMGNKIK